MKSNWPTKKLGEKIKTKEMLELKIKRGKESWDFIYLVFGILVAVATFLIGVFPLDWKLKIGFFVIALPILAWFCVFNPKFQNTLIGWKSRIENTWRKIK